jgi:hypothetical protein
MKMDIADRADQEIESMMMERLHRARKTKPVQEHKGDCDCFCGEKTGVRFCGPECRDEFDRVERARARNGT